MLKITKNWDVQLQHTAVIWSVDNYRLVILELGFTLTAVIWSVGSNLLVI